MSADKLSKTAIGECRLYFLREAAKDPQIRLGESLDAMVFKPSRKLWAQLGLPAPQRPSNEYTPEQWLASERYQTERWRLIEEWAAHHHLPYEWVHKAAIDTLAYQFSPDNAFVQIPGYTPPDRIWPAWAFEHESEGDYRKRMRQAVDAYIHNVKLARRRVLQHRKSRIDGVSSQATQYRWAAEHVCLGWGWSKIAKENPKCVDWQVVQQAVPLILKRIEISANSTEESTS